VAEVLTGGVGALLRAEARRGDALGLRGGMGGGREARVPFVGRRMPWRAGLAWGARRGSRPEIAAERYAARKVREEGDGADRRARGLSESDVRAGRAD